MNKISKVILIILIILLIPVTIISLPWLLIFGLSILEPSPPAPEIKYGEFPFVLEYIIDGDFVVVQDVVICEYNGISWNEGAGKHRVWKKRLKNREEENVLIVEDGDIKIYCNVGDAEYYMNDQKYSEVSSLTPTFYPNIGGLFFSQEDIMDKYKIELVSWKFSEPIN